MATEPQQVVKFEYQQSLSFAAGTGKSWSEQVAVSVRILSEAFSSGWYREKFGKDAKSFIVLMAIVMHARPLRGNDLDLLIRLDMAASEDEGRLYARVTDMGLANELGIHRVTVAECAERLAEKGALRVVVIPEGIEFRDSHGQFAGSKAYLISGSLDDILQKAIDYRVEKTKTAKSPSSHHVGKTNTVDEIRETHHVEETGTDHVTFSDSYVRKADINIDSDSDGVGVNGSAAAHLPRALAYFARRKNSPGYRPTEKETAGLDALLSDGFDMETEIIPGIDQAFEKAKSPIGSFNYCVQVIRQGHKKHEQELADLAPLYVPADLAEAVQILTQAFGTPERSVLVRLTTMAAQYDATAKAEDSSGGEWVAEAIIESLGQANPQYVLSYARKILQGWKAHGRCKRQTSAAQHVDAPPEMAVFHAATGRLPLLDQVDLAARTIRENNLTAAYLKPFWEEWIMRDRRRTDLTWLTWAVKGEIPDNYSGGRKESGLEQLMRNAAMVLQREE